MRMVAGPPQRNVMRPPASSAVARLVPPGSTSEPHRSTSRTGCSWAAALPGWLATIAHRSALAARQSASGRCALRTLRIAEIPDQRLLGLRIGKADHAVAVRVQNVTLGQGPIADPRLRVAVHRLDASELRVGLVSDGTEPQALL